MYPGVTEDVCVPILEEVSNLKFSGHESFHCRPFWLKKGVDYIKSGQSFTDKAGVDLGVGKNMVGSIRFWLKAFDIVDEKDNLTTLACLLYTSPSPRDS